MVHVRLLFGNLSRLTLMRAASEFQLPNTLQKELPCPYLTLRPSICLSGRGAMF